MHIGLPDSDLPLTAEVVAVTGYDVDGPDQIVGHGHPRRDVVDAITWLPGDDGRWLSSCRHADHVPRLKDDNGVNHAHDGWLDD